jgi:hypothetical protein
VNSFEEVAEALADVSDSDMSRLAKLADMMVRLERRKADMEAELKDVDKQIQQVQEHEIPALMAELGVKSFKLENGAEVTVKNYYSASINKERQDEAFLWLNDNGFGDLIKNVVSTNFNRGQEEVAERFAQECYNRGLNASTKKWVEPMTLKAFAKEQIEKGESLPDELFGVYVGQKASIKKG